MQIVSNLFSGKSKKTIIYWISPKSSKNFVIDYLVMLSTLQNPVIHVQPTCPLWCDGSHSYKEKTYFLWYCNYVCVPRKYMKKKDLFPMVV